LAGQVHLHPAGQSRFTRGCTNGSSGTSPHAPISAFRSWWQAISRVRLSQFVRQTDLVGAVPLMLIWVAGMGLWLSWRLRC
jgi:hypothetical protein